jgi:hypothetical protein
MTHPNIDQIIWDLAGINVEGSPVAAVPWDRPPIVWIDGEFLHWKYVRFAGDTDADEFPVGFGPITMTDQPVPTPVGLGMLREFVNLQRRDVDAIAAFASRWGVLHLCRHLLPRTHPQPLPPLPGDEGRDGPYCQTVYGEDVEGSEPLAGWKWWALRARAILRIASTFDGDPSRVDLVKQWAILLPPPIAKAAAADNNVSRSRLGAEVETWLRIGAVQPRVDLLQEPHLRVGGQELFGMIALQLASAITGGGLTFCHECANAYVPKRQPAAGRRNYCEACRERKVPERDAARDSRQRPPGTRRPRKRRASDGTDRYAALTSTNEGTVEVIDRREREQKTTFIGER